MRTLGEGSIGALIGYKLRGGYVLVDHVQEDGGVCFGIVINSNSQKVKFGDSILFENATGCYFGEGDPYAFVDERYIIGIKPRSGKLIETSKKEDSWTRKSSKLN